MSTPAATLAVRKLHGAIAAAVAVASAACSGEAPSTGLVTEPIQVAGGQFFAGALPGTPPPPADAGTSDTILDAGDAGEAAPGSGLPQVAQIPTVGSPPFPIYSGQGAVSVGGGYTTPNATSIGVRFADLGSGYWIVPVGAIDSTMMFDRSFGFKASFSPSNPPGIHDLLFVAIDGTGNAGPQVDSTVCFAPSVPDYVSTPKASHACNPTAPLPALVVSLKWDANFDLDLNVVFPDGSVFNPKGANPDADGGVKLPPDAPFFDRDSMRNCYADGFRQEDLVFPTTPPQGNYLLYVDPFASCGQIATTFTLTVYQTKGVCPGCAQEPVFAQSGQLLSNDTTGGAAIGLFVHTYTSNQ